MIFRQDIKDEYFEWLCDYVCKGRAHDKVSYVKLFDFLHRVEFEYSIPNDINRYMDGIDLRYRFAMSQDNEFLVDVLDGPCTVLEMMVALAIRCEEQIMDDTRYGNRTGQWFWNMISNLGIGNMTDEKYDEELLKQIIYDFLDRNYKPDGKGGLFYIRGCKDDLRYVEIWTQLCWYLDYFT